MTNSSTIPNYFFDASALVKLVLQEPGSRKASQLKHDARRVYTSWILVAEALGVLKRLWLRKQIDDRGYTKAVYVLLRFLRLGSIEPVDIEIRNGHPKLVTHEADLIDMKTRHPNLDAADMFQLVVIRDSWLKYYAGQSATKLVTADKNLEVAAKSESIPTVLLGPSDP